MNDDGILSEKSVEMCYKDCKGSENGRETKEMSSAWDCEVV